MFGMGTGVSPPPLPPENPKQLHIGMIGCRMIVHKKFGQAARLISTGRLNALPHLHLRPIDQVISLEPLGWLPSGRPHLEVGFALRCFQRLSPPDIATRRYHWRDSRYTRGPSVPVLSY